MRALPLLALIALAACKPATPTADHAPAADPTREPVLASELLLRQSTPELNFRWSAPPEAAVEPKLFRLLRADAEKALADAETEAKQTAADAKKDGFPFRGNDFQQQWKPEAETPALIALSSQTYSFTGGAHGNMGYSPVIFDRSTGKRIAFGDLFANADQAYQALTPAWCKALNEARAEKRGADMQAVGELFNDCPPLKEQTVVPVGEGRVDQLRVLVDPYVAGPWAEGGYEVTLPVDAVRPMLKTVYAKDFAPS